MGASHRGISAERRILAGQAGDSDDVHYARKRLPPRSRASMLAAGVVLWEIRNMESNPMLEEVWRIKDKLARDAGDDAQRWCQETR